MNNNMKYIDDLIQSLAENLAGEYDKSGLESTDIGALFDLREDGYRCICFEGSGLPENAWDISNTIITDQLIGLWEKMNREWDSILFMADIETGAYSFEFYHEDQVKKWRTTIDDFHGIFNHYLSIRDEKLT